MRPKKINLLFAGILSCFLLLAHQTDGIAKEVLPDLVLTTPEDEGYKSYLGITAKNGSTFRVADIQTDILLIELFSMYCPYCQEEAPRVNELYALAEGLEEKGTRLKLIGLGASNTQFEVDYFKESFDVQFPLFPDKTLAHYKKLDGDGTPGFIGVVFSAEKPPEIILRQSGGFDDAGDFLRLLLDKAGWKK